MPNEFLNTSFSIMPLIRRTIQRLMFMFPAHALVFILTWLGIGPSPISILSFLNLPLIYILVRKSPTFIHFPLLIALTLGAALAHNEPTTSPMESYFEGYSILTIVGMSIATVTLIPMMITKFITLKINQRFENFTHDINSRLIFPVVWTTSWSLFRRFSPLGSWGDWSYAIDNSGYTGDPIIQIASIGGLSAINFFLALWMQVISDFFILRHRISKTTRTLIVNEETPLIPQPLLSDDNVKVYKEDMTKNYYLRVAMIIAILGCFVIGGQRLNNIESNIDHMQTVVVGCVLPSNDLSMDEMLKNTRTIVTNLHAKIVLWSESAIVLGGHEDYKKLIDGARNIAYRSKAYLGLTYIIPSGNSNKKRNMLTFIGPNNDTLFEYQKTHPVPLVESYSIESGPGRLSSVNIELPREKNQTALNLSVSGAICLDMDFPELLGQAADVDLVLSPAQTWSAHVGLQHLRMSSVRSVENGYWILRCDGGGASGLIGKNTYSIIEFLFFELL
jgi:apolipoprotein N-acyltransferase